MKIIFDRNPACYLNISMKLKLKIVDTFILILALGNIFYGFNIYDTAEITLYFIYLNNYKKCFSFIEKIIISIAFQNLKYKKDVFNILLAIHLHFIPKISIDFALLSFFNTLKRFTNQKYFFNEIFDMREYLSKFLAFALLAILMLIGIQILIFKNGQINTKRKLFHFFAFLFFYEKQEIFLKLYFHLLYLILVMTTECNFEFLFEYFKSSKDVGKYTLSHIFLIAACLYPYFLIQSKLKYCCSLISICFLDSFASLTGLYFKKTKKSFLGMIGGLIASNMIYFILYNSFDMFKYFLVIGIIEYYTEQNDNIIIPYVSVLYFRYF